MITIFIILIFIFVLTFKEYFFQMVTSYEDAVMSAAYYHAIEERLDKSVTSYQEKLIVLYCSGCETIESKITTELFNAIGNNINDVQLSKIDLSRCDNPLNLIRGFIHPKYLIKDSFYRGEPTEAPQPDESSQYQLSNSLASYFHNHDDIRDSEVECSGPDFYTNEKSDGTILESKSGLEEYEESDEYSQQECDYFLVYKTPTILFELKDHAYIKFPIRFPIQTYPCTIEQKKEYRDNIELFIKQLKYWIYYLKEFARSIIGLYDLVEIDQSSSCRDAMISQITDTVNAKDAFYNLIGKYYNILENAFPKTKTEVEKLENYPNFYRTLDNNPSEIQDDDAVNLDYLRVNRTRIPYLENKLLLTDPENITIRGNPHRLNSFAARTLIISFPIIFSNPDFEISLVENASGPYDFMTKIRQKVLCASNVVSGNLNKLKKIFKCKGFPENPEQNWRYFFDPKTGSVQENYGWFLLTFDNEIELEERVCIRESQGTGGSIDLCFEKYPSDYFSRAMAHTSSMDVNVRRFQNIILPALLEYGFIKSNHEQNRLFGCTNAKGQDSTVPDTVTQVADECLRNISCT
jgi:hypothetical protein